MGTKIKEESKEGRVKTLKIAAHMIIDKAEEIIGENELCRGHIVRIELFPGKVPVIKTEIETLIDVYGLTGKYEVLE